MIRGSKRVAEAIGVISLTASQSIAAASLPVDEVIAIIAQRDILAGAAEHRISTVTAEQRIVALITTELIVAID